jgi:hypothetical protein
MELNNIMLTIFTVHFISYHLTSGIFHYFDKTKILKKYKRTDTDTLEYWDMLPQILCNEFFVLFPSIYFSSRWNIIRVHSEYKSDDLYMNMFHLIMLILSHDLFFYVGHRILHTRWGYRLFRHDIHHSTFASRACSSIYMHPFDFLMEVVIPFFAWFIIYCTLFDKTINMWVFLISILIGQTTAMYEHSGYQFFTFNGHPIPMLDTSKHEYHHIVSKNKSFSDGVLSLGIWDRIFKTNV